MPDHSLGGWGPEPERNADLVCFLPGDLEAPVPPSCHPWAFSPVRKTSSTSPCQLVTLLVTEEEVPWERRAEGWRGLPSLWCPPANTRGASRVLRGHQAGTAAIWEGFWAGVSSGVPRTASCYATDGRFGGEVGNSSRGGRVPATARAKEEGWTSFCDYQIVLNLQASV